VQLHKGRVEILDGPGAHFRIRIPRRRDSREEAA
jgi:signal transduction histidine kinase